MTREVILENAARLLVKSSAGGMAMSELVKATGVPASSIYWHFGSKEGVISAVVETGVHRWLQQFPELSLSPEMNEEQIRSALTPIVTSLIKDSQFVRLLLKVGLEFSEADNDCFKIVQRARTEVVSYGVRMISPLFHAMSTVDAEAAARRVMRQVMAHADGIAISLSIEKDVVAAQEMFIGIIDIVLSQVALERRRHRG